MAMGVYYCQVGNSKWLFRCLGATMVLGLAFVAIKLQFEWGPKIAYGVFPGSLWNPDPHHYPTLASFRGAGPLGALLFLLLHHDRHARLRT
jgi:hypothetical protein